MSCQQSFFRLPVMRPLRDDTTTSENGISGYWGPHPSFVPPSGSPYQSISSAGSVGWPGGPTTGSVFFRRGSDSGKYCRADANFLTTFVKGYSRESSYWHSTYDIRRAASGSVTVKGFFSDGSQNEQRQNGIFLRLRSEVVSFSVPPLPTTTESIPRTQFYYGPLFSTYGAPPYGISVIHYGPPSMLATYSDDELLWAANHRRYYEGAKYRLSSQRGRQYHQTTHVFEFGAVVNGECVVAETQYIADCDDRYLSLGMDRCAAFACVSSAGRWFDYTNKTISTSGGGAMMNGFLPRLFFQPLVINNYLNVNEDNGPPVAYVDRHPLEFVIEVGESTQSILVDEDLETRSNQLSVDNPPTATVLLPSFVATPREGREVHDTRSRVSTMTASRRLQSYEAHEQYAFMMATTDAAQYQAASVSYWPGAQQQTDIAIPFGSSAHGTVDSTSLKIILEHDPTEKQQREAGVYYSFNMARESLRSTLQAGIGGGIGGYDPQLPTSTPKWPATVKLGGEFLGAPTLPDGFDSLVFPDGRSRYELSLEWAGEYRPTKLGHFGDIDIDLKQKTADGRPIQGQWYGYKKTSLTNPRLSTGSDPQVVTTTFLLRTIDGLWPEWRQKMYDPATSSWSTLWGPESQYAGIFPDGREAPFRPYTNWSSITAWFQESSSIFNSFGSVFTRYHFVDEHEATVQNNASLNGIPPGLDANGVAFTQRWTDAKSAFRDAVRDIWQRSADFSETVDVEAYSALESVEARAELVVNSFNINSTPVGESTGEASPQAPVWWRLVKGASKLTTLPGIATARDPAISCEVIGNVKDVVNVDVYGATASFGEPTEYMVKGRAWMGDRDKYNIDLYDESIRDTPNYRVYAVPCTVTFFTDKKTATKSFNFHRRIGSFGLAPDASFPSGFAISSQTGDVYRKTQTSQFDLSLAGLESYSVDWA